MDSHSQWYAKGLAISGVTEKEVNANRIKAIFPASLFLSFQNSPQNSTFLDSVACVQHPLVLHFNKRRDLIWKAQLESADESTVLTKSLLAL